uniref:Ig-like domain-containing protein n=1 Tax=Anopheles melas TaxID=34690 RepID=A0A182UI74_9DIPT
MGEYSCEADNAVGSITASAPPSFLVRPKNVIIEPGSEALFECQATGHPHPTLFWSVEGNRTLLVPGSRLDNLEVTQNADGTSVLSIAQVGRMDNGKVIVCSAVNSVGSVSTRVVLSVNLQDDRPPPLILQGPCNQTLPIKSVAILPCKASGIPPPVISWYKDGIPVLASEKINITKSGTLTIADLSKIDDSGLYTCVASRILRTYNIIVRGVDLRTNYSKVLSNVTIEATSSTLLLANLTEGVTYTVSVAAATSVGMGPFSNPATLRLDPITKQLDQTSHRYPINHNNMDDILTQPWFIAVLGCILVLMMLSFGAMVFVKRKHMMMKQSALTSLRAHAAGGVVKIPRNDSLWMDPSGMVWGHQSTRRGKDHIQDYAPVGTSSTLPLEQQQQNTMLHHNRTRYVEYTDYPSDYAEVSSFNPPTSDGMNHLPAQLNASRAPSEYSSGEWKLEWPEQCSQ